MGSSIAIVFIILNVYILDVYLLVQDSEIPTNPSNWRQYTCDQLLCFAEIKVTAQQMLKCSDELQYFGIIGISDAI